MKAFVINVIGDIGLVFAAILLIRELGVDRATSRSSRPRPRRSTIERVDDRRDLPAAARRRLRQVRAGAAPHLAAGRDGGPDAGQRADPRGDDGDRGRLPDRARPFPLFELAPTAADIGAFIGLATLLIAATIALVVTDLKRIIAYSTMSQIGYMVVGVSIGAYTAGLFHLMTHAFFKALLFMAAGSVIAAMADQPEHRPDGRLPRGAAVHLRPADDRRARARRLPGHLGLLQQGRDPRLRRRARRHVLDLRDRRLPRRDPDRLLRVPDRLPGRLRRARARRRRSSRRATWRTASPRTPRPASPRTPTSASRGPSTTSPSAPSRCGAAMSVLGFGALFAGVLQVPGVTDVITHVPRGDVRGLDRSSSVEVSDDGRLPRAARRRRLLVHRDRRRVLRST